MCSWGDVIPIVDQLVCFWIVSLHSKKLVECNCCVSKFGGTLVWKSVVTELIVLFELIYLEFMPIHELYWTNCMESPIENSGNSVLTTLGQSLSKNSENCPHWISFLLPTVVFVGWLMLLGCLIWLDELWRVVLVCYLNFRVANFLGIRMNFWIVLALILISLWLIV